MSDMAVNKNIRILLVEDEEKLRNTILDYLHLCGYQMVEAHNGADALRAFFIEEKKWPDIILLDLMLPSVNGFDVLAKIREK